MGTSLSSTAGPGLRSWCGAETPCSLDIPPGFLKKDFLNLFLERGVGREKERKYQCVVASHTPPTGDLAHNPGI